MHRIITVLSFLFLFACSSSRENTDGIFSNDALAASSGGIGEILLVVDTNHLKMELGKQLENVFLDPYPGLPQAELPLDITRIHYKAFGNLFQRHKTIVFAVPFSDGKSAGYMEEVLGKETVAKIMASERKIIVQSNVFAKDQQMIFLFGKSQQEIAQILKEHGSSIIQTIDDREYDRVMEKLYKVGERKKMAAKLKEDLGFTFRIPSDFKLVTGTEEFTWLRLAKEDVDYSIVISERPYTSESQFDSTYIADWRVEMGKNIYGNDSTFVKVVQHLYPIQSKIIAEPIYIREDRGLWKLTSNIVGGPFLSRVRVGNSGKQIYYIEGFVIAPGRDKREFMREIEVMLSTFEG